MTLCPHLLARPTQLAQAWRSLEDDRHSPFQRWAWIETWLAELPGRVESVGIELHDHLGLAGVACMASVAGSQRWALGHTGDDDLDVIFVEHNGLVTRPDVDLVDAYRVLIEVAEGLSARELRVDGTADGAVIARSVGERALARRAVKPSPHRTVGAGDARRWIEAMPGESGRRLRRSLALYEVEGPLMIHRHVEFSDRRAALHTLSAQSIEHWQARGHESCFGNPFFAAFHERLVASHPELVRLQTVACGQRPIALLYGLEWPGGVCAYQSVRREERDNRLRPGLVAHALAMDDARPAHGCTRYDLLAGGERYKQQLATGATELTWLVVAAGR